jgi:YHS domain-containing protein
MKEKHILSVLLFFLLILSCEKSDIGKGVPKCINDMIDDIEKEEVRNPPTKVWKWEVDGSTYYYITSDCCDQYNYLYDENCNVVCAPDGGFTGNGDGNCPVFIKQIVSTLIWKDSRD